MRDNPEDIAAYLRQERGRDDAIAHALQEALDAQRAGDNYVLSVWRDVKRILAHQEG